MRFLRPPSWLCLTRPPLVIYLFTVAATAWSVIVIETGRKGGSLFFVTLNVMVFANLVLSFLINIFATSIIAVKAW